MEQGRLAKLLKLKNFIMEMGELYYIISMSLDNAKRVRCDSDDYRVMWIKIKIYV